MIDLGGWCVVHCKYISTYGVCSTGCGAVESEKTDAVYFSDGGVSEGFVLCQVSVSH